MRRTSFVLLISALMTTGCSDSSWKEIKTEFGYNLIIQKDGQTLGYNPESGVTVVSVDGYAFKDMNRNGSLEPYEDWRLSAEERAAVAKGVLSLLGGVFDAVMGTDIGRSVAAVGSAIADGFTGNIITKTIEGSAKTLFGLIFMTAIAAIIHVIYAAVAQPFGVGAGVSALWNGGKLLAGGGGLRQHRQAVVQPQGSAGEEEAHHLRAQSAV